MATEKLLIDLWSVNMNEVDTSGCTDVEDILSAVVTYLSELPTADAVEVVHGRWEKHEPDKAGNRKPKCSVCGEYHLAWWSDYTHCNYCPNCGAKMDGASDG